MKVSNCCGDPGTKIYFETMSHEPYQYEIQYRELGICAQCKEPCEYVEESTVKKISKKIKTTDNE